MTAGMHPNSALINRFYEAFAKGDTDAMASCYHPDVHFEDRVFRDLNGIEPAAMWRMLCGRSKDLRISHSDVVADDDKGSANWVARYTFAATKRPVVNVISASFRFADNKIVEHTDVFDFWKWSRMALGMPGTLLGWTPLLRNKVCAQANGALQNYIDEHKLRN